MDDGGPFEIRSKARALSDRCGSWLQFHTALRGWILMNLLAFEDRGFRDQISAF